jgi:hypothetical protein
MTEVRIVPEPGKLERAAMVCCEICETITFLAHDDAEKPLSVIQADGWTKVAGKWRCPSCFRDEYDRE